MCTELYNYTGAIFQKKFILFWGLFVETLRFAGVLLLDGLFLWQQSADKE